MSTLMRFLKLAVLVPACTLSFAAFSATASDFLTETEAEVLQAHEASYGLVLSKSEWVEHSETAATIVRAVEANGREILVVERNGLEALLVDDDILKILADDQKLVAELKDPDALLDLMDDTFYTEGLELFLKREPTKVLPKIPPKNHEGGFCGSSCLSKTISGALKGAGVGGAGGAGTGALIGAGFGGVGAGPGALGGLVIGGGGGAIAGGIDGNYECEKDKATSCNK